MTNNADPTRPRMLSVGMAQAAMADAKFYEQMPEFKTLQPKIAAMQAQLRGKGCGGCRRRRLVGNLFSDFLLASLALDADGKARLRTYFGGSPLMAAVINPQTKKYENIVL